MVRQIGKQTGGGWTGWIVLPAVLVMRGPPVEASGLLIADGGLGGALEVKEHDVRVTINNGIAVTEIHQVFQNAENRVVEALYTFPVPNQASVAGFSMWINGKEMTGEVVEKQRARQIYDSYKQARRDPGLLEQVDYKRFEMRIFPIAPGAEQRVRVVYYQELDADHDEATYVFPLATATRAGLDQRVKGKFAFSLEAKSEMPIVEMGSPSHREDFAVVKHSDGYWQASLEAQGGDLGRDLVIAYRLERPKTGFDLLASKERREDGYFLLTLTAGKDLEEREKGMDYVFVLDVSGSMAQEGKLGLSRDSVAAFIENLDREDRFELIAFNVSANALFGKFSDAGEASRAQAREFLGSQKARGGTVLRPAIEAAYRYRDADRALNVVVLSDGMTEQREHRELLQLVGEHPAGVRVFAIGVGNEVNRPLLNQLARDSGGLAAFVSQGDDFQRQAKAFRRKLLRPAATGVKITFEGAEVYDLAPKTLPALYHGSPLRLYGRYKKGGPVTVTVTAEVLGRQFRQSVKAKLPERDEANPQIERMWAWHRVEELQDELRRGSSGAAPDEIVRLCEGYSIASEYASFIVLENDAEYQRWKIARRNATRIESDRRAQLALRSELDRLRRRAEESALPGRADRRAAEVLTSVAEDPGQAGAQKSAPPNSPPAAPQQPGATRRPPDSPRRGWDFDLPGGGALDPITGAALLGFVALAAFARRRSRAPRNRGSA